MVFLFQDTVFHRKSVCPKTFFGHAFFLNIVIGHKALQILCLLKKAQSIRDNSLSVFRLTPFFFRINCIFPKNSLVSSMVCAFIFI